jgi:hypothetical protein
MPGPIVEAVREQLGMEDTPTVREHIEENLAQHRQELDERINGGGCCNAAMAAKATRRNGKEYR